MNVETVSFPYRASYVQTIDGKEVSQPVRVLERFAGRVRIQAIRRLTVKDIRRQLQPGETICVDKRFVIHTKA